MNANTPPNTPLIDVADLAAMDPELVLLVDCRFDLSAPARGREQWLHAHIPGAVYASLDSDLSDLDALGRGLGRHPLPSARAFGESLGRWGWQPDLTLVAYDAGSGAMAAARLWWLMRWMGVSARVLDGGLAAWQDAEQPLAAGPEPREPTHVVVHFDPEQVLMTPQLQQAMDSDQAWLLDARARPRYEGREEPIDDKAGHVPDAHNRPFSHNLVEGRQFHRAEHLRLDFEALLAGTDPTRVVHMCGSGVTACHNLLAMEQAGLHGSRLYAPSWSGWISDPGNPIETGPNP